MFREPHTTIYRIVLALLGLLSLEPLLRLPTAHSATETILSLLSIVIGLFLLYLAWDIKRLLPAWRRHIIAAFWTIFGIGIIEMLLAAFTFPLDPPLSAEEALVTTSVGIGLSFLITAYLVWSVKHITHFPAESERRAGRNTQLRYWGAFAAFLIVLVAVFAYVLT